MHFNAKDTPPQSELMRRFNYDPATGQFVRLIGSRKVKPGTVAGSLNRGYVKISIDSRPYFAHRLAWVYMTGEQPSMGIDHINGNRSDNRWSNLRVSSQTDNMCNASSRKHNRTGLKGVTKHNDSKYVARICYADRRQYLGCFKTAEEAKAAYDAAAKILHGEFFKS